MKKERRLLEPEHMWSRTIGEAFILPFILQASDAPKIDVKRRSF